MAPRFIPIDIKEDGLADLPQQLVDEEITVYHSTPTVYRYFISELNEAQRAGRVSERAPGRAWRRKGKPR